MNEFWVITGAVTESSAALAEKCRQLAEQKGLSLKIILVRKSGPLWVDAAVEALKKQWLLRRPDAIIFECDRFFSEVAPAFAFSIGRGITADCTSLEWDGRFGLLQIRPTFGGRKIAVNRSMDKPYIATVRVGCFGRASTGLEGISVEELDVGESLSPIELLGYLSHTEEQKSLQSSEIILSGGLGMGGKENFRKLRELARRIGAGAGASRAAVAAGYADYSSQVGQTGVSVQPRLYVAFGISGAVQHLSGILGAGTIAAVNIDPSAPIHDYSDYSLIADCGDVLDALLRKI